MKTARLLVFGVAMTAGLGAAYLVMGSKPPEPVRVIAPAPPPVETDSILLAAHDLGLGVVLSEPDMHWQTWPKAQVPAGVIVRSLRPNAADELKGSRVLAAFGTGEPLRLERLSKTSGSGFLSFLLPSGARAVAIPIDDKGTATAGNFILPNDRVDVIRTFHPDDGAPGSFASETLVTNIRVLAIGQAIQEKAGEHVIGGTTATLELTPDQAERVILAQRTSQLSLSLRSQADSAHDPVAPKVDQPQSMTIVRFGNSSQARAR